MNAGVLTLSDKGSRGERQDTSGPIIEKMLEEIHIRTEIRKCLPDDLDSIVDTLKDWTDNFDLDLIITTGGTGLSPRDVTPEATLKIIDRRILGMEEVMRMKSLEKTPNAMISRAVTGARDKTLIINLPGSPNAVRECLSSIMPALVHALKKLGGDMNDCARAEV